MYRAKIICHSSAPDSPPLMTCEIEYPRITLAEVLTHRKCRGTFGEFDLVASDATTTEDISKNSASSRAIPFARMIDKVATDPYVPERFSKNGPGMQGHGWLEGADHDRALAAWTEARNSAMRLANDMHDAGVHKQDVNRLLEPWAWVTQVLTADDRGWNNFFALRCHAGAAPAFQKVARMLYLEYRKSAPTPLGYGEWHLPFVDPADKAGFRWAPPADDTGPRWGGPLPDLIQFSAARAAWVSYSNHDKDGTPEQMKATFARLMAGDPKHASPVEHQATPLNPAMAGVEHLRSNLTGWVQARKLVVGERTAYYAPPDAEIASWGLS